jgi:hypothetical protein
MLDACSELCTHSITKVDGVPISASENSVLTHPFKLKVQMEVEFGSPSTLVKRAGLMQGDILKCLIADESDP